MIDEVSLRRYGRALLATIMMLVAMAIFPGASDPFSLPKATLIALAAVAAAGLLIGSSWRPLAENRLRWFTLSLGAFVLLGIVAVVIAPVTWIALVGRDGRHSGMVLYGSCALLALLAARTLRSDDGRILLRAGVMATAFNAGYALLQRFGVDPVAWTGDVGDVVATMGNPNFAAGYVAIGGSLAVGAALFEPSRIWRAFAIATVVAATAASVVTGSAQGPLALAAGVAVPVLVAVIGLPAAQRRTGLAAYAVAALVGLGGLVSAAFNVGPLAAFLAGGTLEARLWYWRAAWDMFLDHPLLGVGMDMFGSFYRSYRPIEATLELGIKSTSDAVHSVPLAMLAQGGVLLAAAYLAMVSVTLWALMRGIGRTQGQERLLLGAFGGAWTAYQLQSLVSIDVPSLALWHFVSAGVIVALGSGASGTTSMGRKSSRSRSQKGAVVPTAAVVTAGVLVMALWPLTRPLRADGHAGDGRRLVAAGRVDKGLDAYRQAIRLAPWHAGYGVHMADAYFARGRTREGYREIQHAAAADPTSLPAVLTAARAADLVGDKSAAASYYAHALRVDPRAPELLAEAADFALRSGDAGRAIALLEQLLALRPGLDGSWVALGRAYAAADEETKARAAYHRALKLVPGHGAALEGLAALDERS